MKLLWITFLAINLIVAAENIQPIITGMKMFQMSNPSILHSSLNKREQIQLIKYFSNNGQKIVFNPIKSNPHDFMVIFTELADYQWDKYPETQVPSLGKIQLAQKYEYVIQE